MLMQKTAREALGISLKESVLSLPPWIHLTLSHRHVVIIDEAHNLIESILSLHTIVITSSMLRSIRSALVTYFTKFKTKFKGSNAAYLKQLLLVMKGLLDFAEGWGKEGGGEKKEAMMGVNEVVQSLKGGALDQVNFLKLDTYLKESQIGRKIGGYVDSLAEEKTVKGESALMRTAGPITDEDPLEQVVKRSDPTRRGTSIVSNPSSSPSSTQTPTVVSCSHPRRLQHVQRRRNRQQSLPRSRYR